MPFAFSPAVLAAVAAILSLTAAIPTRNVDTILHQANSCPINNVCFAMDQSGSVRGFYPTEQEFVVKIAKEIAKRTTGTEYSAYGFSNGPILIRKSTTDLEGDFIPAVENPVSPSGGTNMAAGLNACFNEIKGDIGNRLIVLVTDGKDNGSPRADVVAPDIKKAGLSIVTVGIGSSVDEKYLKNLASGPEFFVKSSSFSTLLSRVVDVVEDSCNVVVVTPEPVVVVSPEPVVVVSPEPVVVVSPEPVVVVSPEPVVVVSPEPVVVVSPEPEPVLVVSPEPVVVVSPEPVVVVSPEPVVVVSPEPEPVLVVSPEPVLVVSPEPVVVVSPEPAVVVSPVPPTETPIIPTPPDSCANAYDSCDFRFAGSTSVPTFSVTGNPDTAFTPKIISKEADENIGVLNSNNIVPEFIMIDGTTVKITEAMASPSFTSTHFKPYYIKNEMGSGIGHQTYHGNQKSVARFRCIRVYFSSYQLLQRAPPYVRQNIHVGKSANKCVVFRSA